MALKPLQAVMPLGQFDCLDALVSTVKGGEVVKFAATAATPGDKAVADSFDGYANPSSSAVRPLLRLATTGDGYATRPLMLADDGIAGYGTLFGTLVGGTGGQIVSGGTVLGPSTASGSGKLTAWGQPGLYAVSLDACDTNASAGLQPTNVNSYMTTGAALTFDSAGLLTTVASARGVAGLSPLAAVGNFVAFETNGSLVSTPNRLVAALNSPSGLVSSVGPRQFAFATFWFSPVSASA